MAEALGPSPNDKKINNIAFQIPEDERKKIAQSIIQWYKDDKHGRRDWEERRTRYYKLWLGQRDKKVDPWPGASNVCLPLLAIAVNQFHARSYQAFFSPPSFVKTLPVQANDEDRAKKVADFMNWQLMYEMEDYEEQTDKLLLNVPISGTNFKKVFYDRENERPTSEYISGLNVIVPYRTTSLESARRITHENWKHYDELEQMNEVDKFYIDFDKVQRHPDRELFEDSIESIKDKVNTESGAPEDKPKLLLECHTRWKLKGDKKPEPYIFFVDYDSGTLLRCVSRKVNGKPVNFFVDYHFIPNPEGYYSFGFGHFLEVLNEMLNTAFNQVFDAGRISNQPFGFYGRRAGIKRREMKLWPGRMEEVEDASQVFFPSMQRVDQVLFQVMGMIQQYSEQFTSVSDFLTGRQPKNIRNPTATGTVALIEQGLIFYSIMIKRLFRSLKKELGLIYAVDSLFLPEKKQFRVVGAEDKVAFPEIKRKDFDGKMDVIPLGDPSFASKITRRQEAMELYQMMINNPLVGVNPGLQLANPRAIYKITKEVVETYERKSLHNILPDLPPESVPADEENGMFLQGDTKDPQQGEDHLQHLRVHQTFKNSELYREMPKDRKALLDKHIEKTKALIFSEIANRANLGAAPTDILGAPGPQRPNAIPNSPGPAGGQGPQGFVPTIETDTVPGGGPQPGGVPVGPGL